MSNKKMMSFLIELPFPEGDISCERCKLLAKSCVGQAHCMVTGDAIHVTKKERHIGCPLKPM